MTSLASLVWTKMEACGNHFAITHDDGRAPEWSALARTLARRHFGIGTDGIFIIRPSKDADYQVLMYNPDGSLMGMCGNGIRCATRYVSEVLGFRNSIVTFIVEGRLIRCELVDRGARVRVDMGEVTYDPARIPLRSPTRWRDEPLSCANGSFLASAVSVGNPHLVLFGECDARDAVTSIGPILEHHPQFPERTNVEFVSVVGSDLSIEVWERGAGRTLACGTAACACAFVSADTGRTGASVGVIFPGGRVEVEIVGSDAFLTGNARFVFHGTVSPEVWGSLEEAR